MIIYGNNLEQIKRHSRTLEKYNFKVVKSIDDILKNILDNEIVILSNIDFEAKESLDLITNLEKMNTKIIVLDPTPSYEKGKKLVAMGIKAYANFMINDVHMSDVIQTVKEGNVWLYPEFINQLVSNILPENNITNLSSKDLDILTQREKEVALLVLEKLPYSDISEKLDISLRTVKAHTKNIYEKFNVSNRLGFLLKFNK